MKIKQASRQTGISMVEVLVALVISLFLLSGIVQVYLGNKTAYRFTEAVARIQENGRFAIESITQDLRMAGFFGCAMFDPEDTSNIVNNLNPSGAGRGRRSQLFRQYYTEGLEGRPAEHHTALQRQHLGRHLRHLQQHRQTRRYRHGQQLPWRGHLSGHQRYN
jgi:type II secretory pathway pseudopilin PulG